eukprot:TRINITY_DN550_c0_g1_i1.p3 TRINITY_DN550_c0_g1~~TRINITY_DN550_c0_g1_i1.p3  ORF type:complete len:143 (+),score=28.75 TRINITY_DN550_c0_g1_i1:305-733(+)
MFAPEGQTLPQLPQLLLSDCRLISHPSCTRPLQFPNPVLQEPPHCALAQERTMFAPEGQTLPQLPQLFKSDAELVSHPLLCRFPSQSRNAPLQDPVHDPLEQTPEKFSPEGHTFAHSPQLLNEVCRSTSHPSVFKSLLQFAK